MPVTALQLSERLTKFEANLPFLIKEKSTALGLRTELTRYADELLDEVGFDDQVGAFSELNAILRKHGIASLDLE